MPLKDAERDSLIQAALRAISLPLDAGDRIDVARNVVASTIRNFAHLVSMDKPKEEKPGDVDTPPDTGEGEEGEQE